MIGHFKNRVDIVSKSDYIPSIMLLIWKLGVFHQSLALMLVQETGIVSVCAMVEIQTNINFVYAIFLFACSNDQDLPLPLHYNSYASQW